jgi:hypothetical protein
MSRHVCKGRFTGVGLRGRRAGNPSWIATVRSAARAAVPLASAMTTVFLLAPPAFAHTRVLSMTVSPKHATVGERTCFHFQLAGQGGKLVRGDRQARRPAVARRGVPPPVLVSSRLHL